MVGALVLIMKYQTCVYQRKQGKRRCIEVIRWILFADDAVLFCKMIKEGIRPPKHHQQNMQTIWTNDIVQKHQNASIQLRRTCKGKLRSVLKIQ